MKATINTGQVLKARSVCDYECIYSLTVLERKGAFAKVVFMGNERRVKVKTDEDGNEFLRPENYSMAPIFRAPAAA